MSEKKAIAASNDRGSNSTSAMSAHRNCALGTAGARDLTGGGPRQSPAMITGELCGWRECRSRT